MLWFMWRWERRVRIQHERGLDMLGRVRQVRLTDETQEFLRETRPLFLPGRWEEKPRREFEMRSFWLVAALGLVSAVWFAWEPKPPVVSADQPAVTGQAVPGAPALSIPAPQPPAGMVYDPVHNSFHYPAAGSHP